MRRAVNTSKDGNGVRSTAAGNTPGKMLRAMSMRPKYSDAHAVVATYLIEATHGEEHQ
jgi:hypothetical protein